MCTSYNTPERDQLNKEYVDQLEQCLLHDRAATDNMAVNEAEGVLKDAGLRTSRKGDRQDGVGVHANSLLDGPDLPITSINGGTNTMAGKPPASAFPETPPSNMPSSQSLGEDPGNTPCTTVPPPEDDDECGIQHDAGPRLACQAPSSGTPTAFHTSTLGQEERPSPCISLATLADLPLSTANTTDAPHSHSDSKVQLKDRGDPIDVSDSERQDSDDPDDDDYLEVQPDDGSDNDNPPRPRKRKRRVPERSPPRRKHGITSFSPAAVADKPNADADVPLTSLHDVETIPIRGFLTRQVLLSKVVYSVSFEEQREHTCYNGPEKPPADLEDRSTHPHAGAKRGSAKRPRTGILNTISRKDDQLLIKLKEQRELSWSEIAEHFPGRSKGSLQVRYSTRLKNRRVGNVANGLDVKTNFGDAARAPRARYGPSRTRRTVNRYSPS
ncbi:hypothetical protein N7492_000861 [Penicillium capsulatum]|uniref:Myb-like domain-containing protein n=1 Tax=Penicillium capsulatum TaxID=69766 RepID=A0A9W9IR93_9EURO|nr:hypothetical protein N7492_000861 [Penicillium capsulatum]